MRSSQCLITALGFRIQVISLCPFTRQNRAARGSALCSLSRSRRRIGDRSNLPIVQMGTSDAEPNSGFRCAGLRCKRFGSHMASHKREIDCASNEESDEPCVVVQKHEDTEDRVAADRPVVSNAEVVEDDATECQ